MELQDKTITTTNITTLSNPILYVPKIMFLTKGKGLHKDVSECRGQEILYKIRCSCRACSAARINLSSSKINIYGEAVPGTGPWIGSLDDGKGGPRRRFSWCCSDRLLFWGDGNGGGGRCVDGDKVRFSG